MSILDMAVIDGVTIGHILSVVVIATVAIAFERLITRYLKKIAKHARLEPNVTNSGTLAFRLLIIIGSVAALVRVGGLPTEWFIAFSALGGAAVGLASTQTIGNFVAGLYLFAARPFKIGDFVRIGTIEGVVQEITLNYTRILTIGNNVVSIINLQVMERDVFNYACRNDGSSGLYCYTFEIGFDHSVSATKTAGIFETVFAEYNERLPKKLDYMLVRSGAFERIYVVYLCVKRAEDIFMFRPLIAEAVFKHWDDERMKEKHSA